MNEQPLPLNAAECEADAIGSYYALIQAIGERVKAGMPLPPCMVSTTWKPRDRRETVA